MKPELKTIAAGDECDEITKTNQATRDDHAGRRVGAAGLRYDVQLDTATSTHTPVDQLSEHAVAAHTKLKQLL